MYCVILDNEPVRHFEEEKELCSCGEETILDLSLCATCCKGIFCIDCGDDINRATQRCFGCKKHVRNSKENNESRLPEFLFDDYEPDIKKCRKVVMINHPLVIPDFLRNFGNQILRNQIFDNQPVPQVNTIVPMEIDNEETTSRD